MGRVAAIVTYGLRAGKGGGGNSGRPYPPILQQVQDERMGLVQDERVGGRAYPPLLNRLRESAIRPS